MAQEQENKGENASEMAQEAQNGAEPAAAGDLTILQEKNDELTNTLQRLQAEFENFRRRTDAEKLAIMERGAENAVLELLPILDNFTLALANVKQESDFTKGVELIYAQMYGALEKLGLEKIEALGKQFDPQEHEALISVESDKEAGTVIEELQTGYKLKSKLLRATKVKVAK